MTNTTHTSNEVIASQDQCPKALTTHEFYAFGTLRSGHRLQWRNIARELITHNLNFDRLETHALITQASWQAGPNSKGEICRESHADLEEEGFGISILKILNDALMTIEENWQGAPAARTFVMLTTRLLSLTSFREVHEGCFLFLRRVQKISLRWARELGQKLQEGHNDEELKILNARLLEMALTCHGTFDVDPHHLQHLLKSDEDIATVTECSIIVHDRCPAVTDDLPASVKPLLRRYWRISYLLEPLLRKQILEDCVGLDRTVRRLWAGYEPGIPWTALKMPNDRWLLTETSSRGDLSPILVHYDLLTGSLLVNGSPLTRLPRSYELHSTFHRMFGKVN